MVLTGKSVGAGAGILGERLENAGSVVGTRQGVAGVLQGYLAEAGREADRAGTDEGRGAACRALVHTAGAAVLAPRPRQAWVQMLAVLAHVLRCTTTNRNRVRVIALGNKRVGSIIPRYRSKIV